MYPESSNTNKARSLSVLEKDKWFAYFSKKTEKIVAALYLVSNLIPEADPLRIKVRAQGLELVSAISRLYADLHGEKDEPLRKIITVLAELESLLAIGQIGGIISSMNHSVIMREMLAFGAELEKECNKSSFIVAPSFFDIGQLSEWKPEVRTEDKDVLYKGHKGQVRQTTSTSSNFSAKQSPVAKQDKNKRQEEIVSIFNKDKNRKLSIKDVSSIIKDCSEKTVQRELLDMVAKGVLKKEGERRWSMYQLI